MTFAKTRAAAAIVAAFCLAMPASAQTPSSEASQAQDLTNCAGAIAAQANLSVLDPAANSGEWAVALGAILARLNREPGVEGMTGRIAADAARSFWREQPAAEREAQATQCRTRFSA